MNVRDVVVLEKDAEVAMDKEDFVVYDTRVSSRTQETFSTGKDDPKYSGTVFMDARLRVFKIKDDKTGEKRVPITKEQLVKGTIVFVESGAVGVDIVPAKDGKEAKYYTKLKTSRIRVIGTRPPKGEAHPAAPATAAATDAKAPAKAPAGKAEPQTERLTPAKPKDDGDKYPDEFFM